MTSKTEIKSLFSGKTFKSGESPEDCADAFAVNDKVKRYAISDGVGQSFYPALWSQILVKRFVYDSDSSNEGIFNHKNWQEWLNLARNRWRVQVERTIQRENKYYLLRQWNEERKTTAGATFVGVQFDTDLLQWRALVVGDSCLFHFSQGKFSSYLLDSPEQFDENPEYFASLEGDQQHLPQFIQGTYRLGDTFVLATDALSEWLLSSMKAPATSQETRDWQSLSRIQDWDTFYGFVKSARQDNINPLKNDDVALVVLHIREETSSKFIPPTQKTPPVALLSIDQQPLPQKEYTVDSSMPSTHEEVMNQVNSTSLSEENKYSRQLRMMQMLSLFAILLSVCSLILSVIALTNPPSSDSDSNISIPTETSTSMALTNPPPSDSDSNISTPTETSTSVPSDVARSTERALTPTRSESSSP